MKAKHAVIWVCSSCGNGTVHTTRVEAEACCVCPDCKRPTPTMGGGRVLCDVCNAKSKLEWERRGLESAANNFMFAKNKLADAEQAQSLADALDTDKPLPHGVFRIGKGLQLSKKKLKKALRGS